MGSSEAKLGGSSLWGLRGRSEEVFRDLGKMAGKRMSHDMVTTSLTGTPSLLDVWGPRKTCVKETFQ